MGLSRQCETVRDSHALRRHSGVRMFVGEYSDAFIEPLLPGAPLACYRRARRLECTPHGLARQLHVHVLSLCPGVKRLEEYGARCASTRCNDATVLHEHREGRRSHVHAPKHLDRTRGLHKPAPYQQSSQPSLFTTPANKFSSRGGGGGGRILWLTPGLDGQADGVAARSQHGENASGAAPAVFKYSNHPNGRVIDARKLVNSRASRPSNGTAWREWSCPAGCSLRPRGVNQWVGENPANERQLAV
jgi:hypothetical protein